MYGLIFVISIAIAVSIALAKGGSAPEKTHAINKRYDVWIFFFSLIVAGISWSLLFIEMIH